MTCAQFTGFNGFEQFGSSCITSDTFKAFSLPPTQEEIVQLSCCWNYTAFACEYTLFISGNLNGNALRADAIRFEHKILQVGTNEKFCVILLANKQLFKVCAEDAENDAKNNGRTSRLSIREMNVPSNGEFITQIACGLSMTVAVTDQNSVYNLPLQIAKLPKHVKVRKVCCGNEHCLILTSNGDVYAFGSSSRGQLGLGSLDAEEQPKLIEALAGVKIIDIAAGGWHSVAASAFGDLYTWGWNVNGQMGLPIMAHEENTSGRSTRLSKKNPSVFPTPQLIDLPLGHGDSGEYEDDDLDHQHEVISVAAGTRHTVLITKSGIILGCGWNKYGQLGLSETDHDRFGVIQSIKGEKKIVCGDWCTVLL